MTPVWSGEALACHGGLRTTSATGRRARSEAPHRNLSCIRIQILPVFFREGPALDRSRLSPSQPPGVRPPHGYGLDAATMRRCFCCRAPLCDARVFAARVARLCDARMFATAARMRSWRAPVHRRRHDRRANPRRHWPRRSSRMRRRASRSAGFSLGGIVALEMIAQAPSASSGSPCSATTARPDPAANAAAAPRRRRAGPRARHGQLHRRQLAAARRAAQRRRCRPARAPRRHGRERRRRGPREPERGRDPSRRQPAAARRASPCRRWFCAARTTSSARLTRIARSPTRIPGATPRDHSRCRALRPARTTRTPSARICAPGWLAPAHSPTHSRAMHRSRSRS